MTGGRVVRGASGLVLMLAFVRVVWGAEDRAEVRVLSGPGAASAITVHAAPEVAIEDRTAGAHPSADRRGPASVGETFTGEISLLLRGFTVSRPSAIDVGDVVVSAVRLFPESGGTTVSVFVRQPVTYTVSRPSAIGDIRIEVRARRPSAGRAARPRQPGAPRLAAPTEAGEGEVAVDAESLSYDQQSDTLTARGGVTLTRGDTTLTADEVVYDRTNQIAEARGHVVLREPQATVEGDFAHLDLANETGWVDQATADLETNHYHVRGGRIEKEGGPRYSVADGVFTTCECGGLEKPSWSILGRSTRVTLKGAGVVRGLNFRVKDVPVFWFPYFVFPANTERQTGFLLPRVGYSNRRGFQYEQPFYWAINKSSDATVALDVETEARIGAIGEYRYRLSRTARGAFVGAYYNEKIRGKDEGVLAPAGTPTNVPENRFLFAGHHTQRLPWDSRYYLDLFVVSDDQLLREIDSFALSANQDYAIRSLRFTTTRTGAIKTWDRGLAWVEGAYFQDLIDPEELALQRLPRVEAEHSIPLLGNRLLGRLSAEGVDYQREDGYDGLRGDISPELFLPFQLGRVVQGSLTGRLRETAYYLTSRDQVAVVVPDEGVTPAAGYERFRVAKKLLPPLESNRTREMGEVHAQLGTEVARVFNFPYLGFEKLRHSIEPEVQYLYVPQVGRPTFEVPLPTCASVINPQPGINCNATLFSEGFLFDERDAINRRNFLSYGITTRILARSPTAAETAARPTAEAAAEEEDDDAADYVGAPQDAIDHDAIAPGIPSLAIPDFVGPPAPPAPPTKGTPPPPAPREILRASILQGYDISRELVGSSHLSDVDLGLRVLPVDYLALSYNATVNVEDSTLRGQAVGLVVREPWWTPSRLARYQTATTIGVGYRFVEQNVNRLNPSSPEALLLGSNGLNEIQGSVYVRLGKYLGFSFISRYDLNTTTVASSTPGQSETLGPHFLERDYLLRIMSRCNCWILDVGVSDKFNPDERLFRVQLTLVGLGSFGRGQQNQNYAGLPGLGGLRRPSAPGVY